MWGGSNGAIINTTITTRATLLNAQVDNGMLALKRSRGEGGATLGGGRRLQLY